MSPGGVVHIPAGIGHSFRNTSETTPAKMIVITPAGLVAVFLDIGAPGVRGQIAPPVSDAGVEAMGAVAEEYGYSSP